MAKTLSSEPLHQKEAVSFPEAFKIWIKVAIYSFGGPAGQIAIMHKFLVEEKKWVTENQFLHALNYCMLLPGPEAQQLATYIGWLLHKTKGGIIAGSLFVLPGFLSILGLSILYISFRDVAFIQGVFIGIKPAVLAIVVGAVIQLGRKALKNEVMLVMAILAFIAIFFLNIGFPYIVIMAGLMGFIGGRIWEEKFYIIRGRKNKLGNGASDKLNLTRPPLLGSISIGLVWLSVWLIPIVLLILFFGIEHTFVKEAIFFSKAAIVTFGGAYSVLAYVAQKSVEVYGWLRPGEMLDGLGMAETTPGPLIQVVQFVGFLGAYRYSHGLDPLVAGLIASVIVTWVTFIPSFLFIFVGAPYIEYLRGNKNLTTALSGITAAVVGVVLNLGLWFSLNTLFGEVNEIKIGAIRIFMPVWQSLNIGTLGITIIAFFIYFLLKLDMIKTILICISCGVFYSLFT